VAIRTEDVYRSLLRRHILPRWGEHGLVDISGIKAAAWAKDLRAGGYSPTTVTAVTHRGRTRGRNGFLRRGSGSCPET
jgi:hypothetical protein